MLTQDEKEMIYYSLNMRAGYIETGDCCLRAIDAVNSGQKDKIKYLTTDQMKALIMIEELMKRVLERNL